MSTVLLADDDQTLRDMYTMHLVSQGYTVHPAVDGQEAIAKAEQVHPDIILLDVMMPKMNGLDVLKLLKTSTKTKDIPVILMTALAQDFSQSNLSVKAEGYFSKPDVLPDQVAQKIAQILGRTAPPAATANQGLTNGSARPLP